MFTRVRIFEHAVSARAISEQQWQYQVIVEQKERRTDPWHVEERYPITADLADARLTRRNVAAMYDVR